MSQPPGRVELGNALGIWPRGRVVLSVSARMFKGLWNSRWRRSEDPLRAALGNLEREVMEVVWRTDETTVREVQALLPRSVAYTTVMTTLDRLFKKGFVGRSLVGRAFVYRALRTRQQLEADVASGLVSGLFSGGAAMPILSNLVDAVGSQDDGADLLSALEEMVRDKRRRMEEDALASHRDRADKKA
jgi:predicted transcriptional regulator